MATTQDMIGLMELANRTANGGVIQVANVLSQRNEFLRGAYWQEANSTTQHKISQVTSLPTGNKRQLNDGVARESAKTKPVWETMEMLEGFSDVDSAAIDMAPNPAAYRAQEDRLYVAGMTKTFATDFISGNVATNGLSMQGLSPRLAALVAGQVVTGGASSSGTMTSVYVVKWGADACSFIYPPGSQVGISAMNLGRRVAAGTTASTQMIVDTTHFKISVGFSVQDSRHIYRIANLATTGTSNVITSTLLINALGAVNESDSTTGCRILMNQNQFNYLNVEANGKANVIYAANDPFGRPVPTFAGIPIDICNAITKTEATVS